MTNGVRIYQGTDKARIGTIIEVTNNHFKVVITTREGTISEKWLRKKCHFAD